MSICLSRILLKLKVLTLRLVNNILSIFDGLLSSAIHRPPIFILGAPRSGSTLLIQAIINSFDIGYISNFNCLLYGSPAFAQCISKNLKLSVNNHSFESFHGTTKGVFAPSECGLFWYRFFRRKPAYVPIDGISSKKLKAFRRSVDALVTALKKPLIFKNLYASLRIQPIVKAFPDALFIVVKRNEIDNGHSILEGRLRAYGNYDKWWSLEPPNIDDLLDLSPPAQVIEQIRSTYQTIEDDLVKMQVPSRQSLWINYEDFCEDPNRAMDELTAFFESNNLSIPRTSPLPSSFARRSEIRVDPDIYEAMKLYSRSTQAL